MIKRVLSFYALVLVPFIYGLNLWLVVKDGGALPIYIGLRVVGVILMIVGLGVWIVSWINLGGSFGILPRSQSRIKRGLYSYLKHPMYWGITGSFLGMGVASGSGAAIMFTILVLVPLLIVRSILEDGKLKE